MNKYTNSFIIVILLIVTDLKSQDIILKKTGEKIESKVVRITESNIEYKKHTNLDGPIYTIHKYEVLQITLESGRVEKFDELPRNKSVGRRTEQVDYTKPQHIEYVEGDFMEQGWYEVKGTKIGRIVLESWIIMLNDEKTSRLYAKFKRARRAAFAFGYGSLGPICIGGIIEDIFETEGYAVGAGILVGAPLIYSGVLLRKRFIRLQKEAIISYNNALL
ncbi:MAG: hypothetical protein JKY53_00580 [Flavobacteriales bacterium]|nr:hypothetical protein [Flavobacteriales bacterium]